MNKMNNHSDHKKNHEGHKHKNDKENAGDSHNGHYSHVHSGHHAMMIDDFQRRFWISLIATIPILVLSPMIQELMNYMLNISTSFT